MEQGNIEVIQLQQEITVVGLNLQNSGLPISFDSLGILWERFGKEGKDIIKNRKEDGAEFGISMNKKPDYLVGVEVTNAELLEGQACYVIPKGTYVKAMICAKDHETLVGEKLQVMMKKAVNWAKKNTSDFKNEYVIEGYPGTIDKDGNLEMFLLIPVKQ
ncbi:GyrI-like domain-containing protein [Anaerosporobacter faecicola]|uniref:GyrI-like domain-containing protein n=1 Tax=Anaerosporobacter faecicola TaxID=2718714 RepID=UPI0014396EEB|nr:effector binding domain-containing protein [Anaerosporobacter faecicola]